MENRPNEQQKNTATGAGQPRIKNITGEIRSQADDQALDMALSKMHRERRAVQNRNKDRSERLASYVKAEETPDLRALASRSSRDQGRTKTPNTPGRTHASRPEAERRLKVSQLSKEFGELPVRKDRVKKRSKRIGRAPKIIALILMLAMIVGAVALIRNFSAAASASRAGLKYYQDGDYAQAVTAFERALAKDETNAEYYVNLGMAKIALSNYDEALSAFDQAVGHTKRDALLMQARRGAGIVYLSQGYYAKAQEQFEEALKFAGQEYGDTEIDILYYLAEAQERAGDSTGAAVSYSKIINDRADADAYMLRGLAYQHAGDYTKAEADLNMAVQMNKKNYRTYLALYEVQMAQGKSEEAAKTLEAALDLGQKSGEDYANRGIIYMHVKDYENAVDAFNKALEKGYDSAYLGLAEAMICQKDYAGAAGQYEYYMAEYGDSAAVYNQYGLCLMALGRYEEAAAAFSSGLALNDRLVDRELMYNEAVVYEYMKDWATAYEKMKAFCEKYPEDAAGLHELAFLESRQ